MNVAFSFYPKISIQSPLEAPRLIEESIKSIKMASSKRDKDLCIGPTNMVNERCYFSHYIEVMDILIKSMSEEQKTKMAATSFAHLLRPPYIKQSRSLLDALLYFWDDKKESCRLNSTMISFVGTDIAFFLGLRATGDEVELYGDEKI
ncbi:hypothetical protein COCNU_scaffold003795G000020 [Cocos nucifera]|nr:hypothetical protein [Cocos nucifera]